MHVLFYSYGNDATTGAKVNTNTVRLNSFRNVLRVLLYGNFASTCEIQKPVRSPMW